MAKKEVTTKFYEFRQNNSGGSFDTDPKRGIGIYVIIEALNLDHANFRAEEIGLYFNGVDNDRDCECCGDRWYPARHYDEKEEINEETARYWLDDSKSWQSFTYIHYLDGTFKTAEEALKG